MRAARSGTRLSASLLVLVALVSCTGGASPTSGTTAPPARPSSPATVTIESPKNGQVVHSATVPLRINLKGARIVKQANLHIDPRKGHVHVSLDGKIVSMNYSLQDSISKVSPGTHVITVEFVASDHRSFDPRVLAEVAFQVKP